MKDNEIIICFKHTIEKDKPLIKRINASLVKFWTKSKYYHVEMVYKNKLISSDTKSGVHILDEFELNKEYYDLFKIQIPELTDYQNEVFWKFLESEKETGYDWLGIFLSQFLFLDNESEDKWFCSEIVSKVLQLLYCKDFIGIKPSKNSPEDIFKILKEKLIKI